MVHKGKMHGFMRMYWAKKVRMEGSKQCSLWFCSKKKWVVGNVTGGEDQETAENLENFILCIGWSGTAWLACGASQNVVCEIKLRT